MVEIETRPARAVQVSDELPWMTQLYTVQDGSGTVTYGQCGGTLISSQWSMYGLYEILSAQLELQLRRLEVFLKDPSEAIRDGCMGDHNAYSMLCQVYSQNILHLQQF